MPHETILRFGVLSNPIANKKRRIFTGDDNQRRTEHVAAFLKNLLTPPEGQPAAICAESFVYHRGIKASAKMGLAWGTLITRALDAQLPLLSATPQEIKIATHGSKKATKEEVQLAVLARYGADLADQLGSVAPSDHEHAYDAVGAVVALLNADVVRLARQSSRIVVGIDMGFAHLGWCVARLHP